MIKGLCFLHRPFFTQQAVCIIISVGDGDMIIRRAQEKDIPQLDKLLFQVNKVHSDGRPDLFKAGAKKYTDDELKKILEDDNTPVFAADDGSGNILGYAFCIFETAHSGAMCDVKTLYIDDLCVDENCRGQKIGTKLYEFVLDFAKKSGCYNVTLNVWALNENAKKFYENCGLSVLKIGMEKIL